MIGSGVGKIDDLLRLGDCGGGGEGRGGQGGGGLEERGSGGDNYTICYSSDAYPSLGK